MSKKDNFERKKKSKSKRRVREIFEINQLKSAPSQLHLSKLIPHKIITSVN
jgi:hypothetical protein